MVAARGFDNITVDGAGRVVVQEDGGDNDYITKIWRVDPVNRSAVQILESDRNRFTPGRAGFLTRKEENSGVIEITEPRPQRQLVSGGKALLPRHEPGALPAGRDLVRRRPAVPVRIAVAPAGRVRFLI